MTKEERQAYAHKLADDIRQKREVPIYPRLVNAYRALRSIEALFMDDADAEAWDEAEGALRSVLMDAGVEFNENGTIKE